MSLVEWQQVLLHKYSVFSKTENGFELNKETHSDETGFSLYFHHNHQNHIVVVISPFYNIIHMVASWTLTPGSASLKSTASLQFFPFFLPQYF